MNAWFIRHLLPLATAVVLAGLYLLGILSFSGFGKLSVVANLIGDNAVLGVAAIGMTFVILSGGIDLSIGAVVACASTLLATLVADGMHPLPAMALTVLAGAVFGLMQGGLIVRYRLPPFLVTLAGMFLARGLAFCLQRQSLAIHHPFLSDTINQGLTIPLGGPGGFTAAASVAAALTLLAHAAATWTTAGRCVYAIGDDEASARLMGLPVSPVKLLVYTLAGACGGLAGVLFASYTQSGDPAALVGFELDAIAAVVIGGTLLRGGVGSVLGTGMGVLILGLIQTLITFKGDLSSWWTRIVIGVLVLVFILLQDAIAILTRRMLARR